jgi:predicted TIM-barrel fold metal-dependent hydrolase
MCAPFVEFLTWDQSTPYGDAFFEMSKNPTCDSPIWSPQSDEELMSKTIQIMSKHNIYGVLCGLPDRVLEWTMAAPGRFMSGCDFTLGQDSPSVDSLRSLRASGRLDVFAEIGNQYAGILPDDSAMEPYWTMAEELDLPTGIHVGPGPGGVIYMGAPGYRARMHSPLTLEEVLVQHPRLRLYVMHAGWPMLDDMLAVLYAHPQVYVDIGVIVYTQQRSEFYRYLKTIVDAGFGKRVMFGSDQMIWPETIERSIAVIEEAPFLSASQKRDIFYNNAARFLRLTESEIARHHGN